MDLLVYLTRLSILIQYIYICNMTEIVARIHQIIQEQQLSSAAFADAIGVQRSSISHVLSGRNKPSLDFILKTLQAFPHISPQWLLLGNDTSTLPLSDSKNHLLATDEKETEIQTANKITDKGDTIDRIVLFHKDGSFQTYHQKD